MLQFVSLVSEKMRRQNFKTDVLRSRAESRARRLAGPRPARRLRSLPQSVVAVSAALKGLAVLLTLVDPARAGRHILKSLPLSTLIYFYLPYSPGPCPLLLAHVYL